MLTSDQYGTLDQHFSALQGQYANGAISDEELRNNFRAFYFTDRALAPRFDGWVKQFPNSYVAHLARAIYYKKIGQQSRGDNYIRDTSVAQIAGMNDAFGVALQDLHACVTLDPKPTLAYGHALDLGSYMGSGDERELLDLAVKVDPHNVIVRLKYMTSLEPRWGGSFEEMDEFLEESRRANLAPSKLKILESVVVQEHAHVDYDAQNWDAAATEYLRAFELDSDDPEFVRFAAQARFELQEWQQVIKLDTRYLEIVPGEVTALRSRAWAYDRLDDPHAVEDFTSAANLGDAYSQNRLGEYNFYGIPGVVTQDRESALKWFRMAAAQKYPEGLKNLQMALAQSKPPSEMRPTSGGGVP